MRIVLSVFCIYGQSKMKLSEDCKIDRGADWLGLTRRGIIRGRGLVIDVT